MSKPRYRTKNFHGLVPYGKARWRMFYEHFRRVSRMEAQGVFSPRDGMEARAPFVARKARPVT